MKKKNFEPEYFEKQEAYWKEVQHILFGDQVPKEKCWYMPEDIVRVLNVITRERGGNHIYTPEGGWANLKQCSLSTEEGAIELGLTTRRLVRPMMLAFDNFGAGALWNHFRLVTRPMEPTGIHPKEYYKEPGRVFETVFQINLVRYARSEESYEAEEGCVEYSEKTREVNRYIAGGDYIIASPVSPLNALTEEDPRLHQKKGDKGFRELIRTLVALEQD